MKYFATWHYYRLHEWFLVCVVEPNYSYKL